MNKEEQEFLRGSDGVDVEVVKREGKTATEEEVVSHEERMLHLEACDVGDNIVQYVMSHLDLTMKQRAWGFCLGTFVLVSDFPGEDEVGTTFDAIAEKANKELSLEAGAENEGTDDEGVKTVGETEEVDGDEAGLVAAGEFAENVTRFIDRHIRQGGLKPVAGAYAMSRAFHNLRRTYPDREGGRGMWDKLARSAGEYYEKNRE